MDIGKGLEHLAALGALIVLGSIVTALLLVITTLALLTRATRLRHRRAAGARQD